MGFLKFKGGNKLEYKKDNLKKEEIGNIKYVEDGYKIHETKIFISDDGSGESITKKLEKFESDFVEVNINKEK